MSEEVIEDIPSKKKGVALPEIVIKILQLIAGGIVLIILIVIISYFVVTAVNKGNAGVQQNINIVEERVTAKPKILSWYEGIGDVRAQTRDNPPKSIRLKIAIGYTEAD